MSAPTRLSPPAPLAHRLAHRYCAAGWRGRALAWKIADSFAWPESLAVRIDDAALALDDSVWLDRALYQGLYERMELELAASLLRRGDACVDVGANVGVYSVLFAVRSRTGPVVAIEPSATFSRLEQNLRPFENAVALNLGVSDRAGTLPLARSGWDDVGASFRDGRRGDAEVRVERLDDLPEVRDLETIDFLKVDTEGWEHAVMAGATELWEERRIGLALVEVNPHWGPVDYLERIEALGYRCFELREKLRTGGLRRGLDLRPLDATELRRQVNVLIARPDMLDRLDQRLTGSAAASA